MFNLRTKQIVLNSNSNVTESTPVSGQKGVVTIAGFGQFQIPTIAEAAARVGEKTVASLAVAGVYTLSTAAFSATKTYDLVLGIRSPRRVSEIFSDGDLFTFQSKAGSTAPGTAFANGQIEGFNTEMVKFSGTSTIIITFQPGYEGAYIESVELRDVTIDTPITVTAAITTAPSEGLGLGRHIEEEVQNATMENLDPYGSKGGNETVDVRGKYTELLWTCVAEDDDSPGWAPHEMLGTGDVNTTANYGPRQFAAYVNEASAAAAIVIINKLIDGQAIPA
jgi:hypothetical protein